MTSNTNPPNRIDFEQMRTLWSWAQAARWALDVDWAVDAHGTHGHVLVAATPVGRYTLSVYHEDSEECGVLAEGRLSVWWSLGAKLRLVGVTTRRSGESRERVIEAAGIVEDDLRERLTPTIEALRIAEQTQAGE